MAKQTFTTGQVLTAAQMTSLQQTAMGGGSTTAKTASYVLVAADAGTVVQMNSASATTITVNTALFAAGDTVEIQNVGAGVCTVTAGTATVSTAGSLALSQYEGGQLYFNTTSAALFFDLVQSSGMTLISTTTLSGASTTLSSIPTTFVSLYLVLFGMTNATANGVLRINPNNGATGNFWGTKITSTTLLAVADGFVGFGATNATRTNADNAVVMELAGTNLTTSSMRPVSLCGTYFDGGAHIGQLNFGNIYQAGGTAITSIVISNTGGNWSTGTALLYGVQ